MRVRVQASFDQESIGRALGLIPPTLRERVPFRLHCGVDPIYAGIHRSETEVLGWTCREIAHYLPAGSALDEHPSPGVIVLPADLRLLYSGGEVAAIVHEYAHAVEDTVGTCSGWPPISDYARLVPDEAFAVAFQNYFVPGTGLWPGAPLGPEAVREALGRDCLDLLDRICSGRWEFGL